MEIAFLGLAFAMGLYVLRAPAPKHAHHVTPHLHFHISATLLGKIVEWTGTGFGLVGSVMLALNNEYSGYGFLAFMVSNTCWIWHGLHTKTWSMVTMQIGFTGINLLGIARWLL